MPMPWRSRAGGCDFAADPERSAADTSVFWRPEIAADVVWCAASHLPSAALPTVQVLLGRAQTVEQADDGTHVLWRTGEQLWLAGLLEPSTKVVASLPFDRTHSRRAVATERVWRHLSGLKLLAERSPSVQTRCQLLLKLRAVTGYETGASYREIATALFGRDRVPSGAAWKTSEWRSRTLRLVGEGRRLVNGGYLNLLA